jgi:NRAMP (natural resistance-associated macrophage protein)-like metal ion transporter
MHMSEEGSSGSAESKARDTVGDAAANSPQRPNVLSKLGAGLVTGAADDDPSGIGTYSQAGAQFGYATLWTLFFTYPLMVAIQLVSARIARVTGLGLAANIARHYPPWLLVSTVTLLLIANVINIGADLAARAAAVQLVFGGVGWLYVIGFAAASLLLQVFLPFPRYAPLLKFLTLALLAYVAVVFVVEVPWQHVLGAVLVPKIAFDPSYILTVVAILGTTISPYLFFWQAAEEVEEQQAIAARKPLARAPEQGKRAFARINTDTILGMAFSNLVAFFIMVTAAATLHAQGVTDIQTAAQAAEALRPIAGDLAFALFALGILGTGMLAVPILAASAAYAVAETFRWPIGLGLKPRQGRKFYAVLAVAMVAGAALTFVPIDPMKALFWSAVVNGIVAVPAMCVMVSIASRRDVMRQFAIRGWLKFLAWVGAAVMALAVVAMAIAVWTGAAS